MFSEALLSGTVKEAAEALARQAVAVRRVKQADLGESLKRFTEGAGHYGSQALHAFREAPAPARNALIGGGLGAVAGLGSAALRDREDDEPVGYMHRALYGGLAGAGLGAATGLMGLGAHTPEAAPAPSEKPPLPEHAWHDAGTGRDMQWPTDPTRVAQMQSEGFDPGSREAFRSPERMSELPLATGSVFGVQRGINALRDNAAPKPGAAPGGFFSWSRQVNPEYSNDPAHLRKGIEEALAGKGRYTHLGDAGALRDFANHNGGKTLQEAARVAEPVGYYPSTAFSSGPPAPSQAALSPLQLKELRRVGAEAAAGEAGFARRVGGFFNSHQYNPNVGGKARALRSGLLPMGLMATESGLRHWANSHQDNATFAERVGRYAQQYQGGK